MVGPGPWIHCRGLGLGTAVGDGNNTGRGWHKLWGVQFWRLMVSVLETVSYWANLLRNLTLSPDLLQQEVNFSPKNTESPFTNLTVHID